jgi:hydroxymethylbilane synthase
VKLRIGTRRSRLAMAQAGEVADRLAAAGVESELLPMVTSGDRGAPVATSPAGVKGLFVAEIVRALQEGEVDVAVHSAKDLPAADDEGVVVAAVPPRADPSDLLVTRDPSLRAGAIVGTSSLRRRAQLLALRPELRIVEMRGNVDRRLRKLEDGEVDGVVLAAAGIARLGVTPPSSEVLPIVPAPGQGCLAVQARAGDDATRQAIASLDDPDSRVAFEAERSLMARLGGGCALPLGALATVSPDAVRLVALVATPDGTRIVRVEAEAETPGGAAEAAAAELLARGAGEILAGVRP